MKRWHLIVGSALIAIPIEALGSPVVAWSALLGQCMFMLGVDFGFLVGQDAGLRMRGMK